MKKWNLNIVVQLTQKWSKITFAFLGSEALLQGVNFLFAIFVIKLLTKQDFAAYSILMAAAAFAGMLINSGLNVGFRKLGGKFHSDDLQFRHLYATANYFRRRQAAFIFPSIYIFALILLLRNGYTPLSAFTTAALFLVGIYPDISRNVQIESLIIQRKWRAVQIHNALLISIKFSAAYLFVKTCPNFNINYVLISTAVGSWCSAFWLGYYGRKHWSPKLGISPSFLEEIKKITNKVWPNALFFSFHNQLGVILLGYLGLTQILAEYGVLTRLTAAFTIVTALMTNIVAPAFGRCNRQNKLKVLYYSNILLLMVISTLIVYIASIFSKEILAVLGPNYQNLNKVFPTAVILAVLTFANTTILRLNQSKGWIDIFSRWSIPVTLVISIAALIIFDITSIQGILLFTIVARIPTLFLRIIDGIIALNKA